MKSSPKIKLITLGCSKNTVDSEVLLKQLAANGLSVAEDSEESEIAIINTCGFIEDAKKESIETILHAVRLKDDGRLKKVIVMGCLSERYAKELAEEIPAVDVYIGANKIDEVVRAVGGDYQYELLGERMLTTPRHYAYLKISEGCDRPCSFCSIPLMRGLHISKPRERILIEARRLAALGVREVILIAQDSTYYGLDLYGTRALSGVLHDLAQIAGIEWIRLMYAYPAGFPADILDVIRSHGNICAYIDMPVQHVSDSVLSSMKRGISGNMLRDLIGNIREKIPHIALRTTLIVGYPTEGDTEFAELLDFVRDVKFDRLGVFSYSQEEGTSAYNLGDPVPHPEKEKRKEIIMEMQRKISLAKNQALIGTTQRILIDELMEDGAIGRTWRDAPEIDNEVYIHATDRLELGSFQNVNIIDAEDFELFAVPASADIPMSITTHTGTG